MANRVLDVLSGDSSPYPQIDEEPRLLLEVRAPYGTDAAWPTPRPGIPLRESTLLVNGHKDLQIGTQVALEIQSADRIDLLCAFVRFAGVRLIRRELQEFLLRGGQMRVIASVYTGSTERRALDELVGLGAKVKISYETSQTRLHAKAWLFQRNTGFATAYVGSSNLTHSALVDGLEWNVRATQVDNAAIIQRIAATFEQYWNEPEFEPYDPRVDGARLQEALDRQSGMRVDLIDAQTRVAIDVAPKPFQVEMLEAIAAERQRGHFRNLVVVADGDGQDLGVGIRLRTLAGAGVRPPSLRRPSRRNPPAKPGGIQDRLTRSVLRRAICRRRATDLQRARLRIDPVPESIYRVGGSERMGRCDRRRIPSRRSGHIPPTARAPAAEDPPRSDRHAGAGRWPRCRPLVR